MLTKVGRSSTLDKIKQDSLNVCICGMLNIPSMGSDSADLASSFMLYVQSTSTFNISDYRELEIGLRSGYLDDIFQQWVLNTPIAFSIKLTRTLQNPERTAKLQYTIYKNYKPSGETLPFYVEDCLGHFNTFIVGESICSYVKGEGWKLLNKLGNMFPDSITVIEAGCLLACDYDAFSKGIIEDPVEKLIKYYNSNEFHSINDVIGGYEESHIMARFMGNWEYFVKPEHKALWSIIVDDKPVSEHTSSGLVESIKEEIKAHAESKGLSYDAMCTIIYRAIPTLLREYYESVEDAAVLEWQNYKRVNGIV